LWLALGKTPSIIPLVNCIYLQTATKNCKQIVVCSALSKLLLVGQLGKQNCTNVAGYGLSGRLWTYSKV
jgi:hypothetical protein